jgi:peptidoglycan hydrolase-like amidase
MVMAANGFSYEKIIDFYYFGILICDIKNVPLNPLKGG